MADIWTLLALSVSRTTKPKTYIAINAWKYETKRLISTYGGGGGGTEDGNVSEDFLDIGFEISTFSGSS